MNHENQSIGRSFWRSWLAANTIGFGAGMALFAAIAEGLEQSGVLGSAELGEKVGHVIGLALAGAILGFVHWRVLRQYVATTVWAIAGMSLGLLLGYIVGYELGGFPFDYLLGPALGGLLASGAQWLALRRHVAGAGWFVSASTFGYLLGGVVAVAIAFLGLGEAIGGTYVGWIVLNGLICAVNGAVGGAIGGAALARSLRQVAPGVPNAALAQSTR